MRPIILVIIIIIIMTSSRGGGGKRTRVSGGMINICIYTYILLPVGIIEWSGVVPHTTASRAGKVFVIMS